MGISDGSWRKDIKGDHAKWDLNDELKAYYEKHADQEKFSLLGPHFKPPDSDKTEEEHDAVII